MVLEIGKTLKSQDDWEKCAMSFNTVKGGQGVALYIMTLDSTDKHLCTCTYMDFIEPNN